MAKEIICKSKELVTLDAANSNISNMQTINSSSTNPRCNSIPAAASSSSTLPSGANLAAPKAAQKERRQQILQEFQEQRLHCEVCQLPTRYKNLVSINKHRQNNHNLPDRDPQIQCPDCCVKYAPCHFVNHNCKARKREPCPFCHVPYSAGRLKAHIKTCPMRISWATPLQMVKSWLFSMICARFVFST